MPFLTQPILFVREPLHHSHRSQKACYNINACLGLTHTSPFSHAHDMQHGAMLDTKIPNGRSTVLATNQAAAQRS